LFPTDPPIQRYEYVTKSFPYDQQNSKGKLNGPDGKPLAQATIDTLKGHTRTVTDGNKDIHGVVYHPFSGGAVNNSFRRAGEIKPNSVEWSQLRLMQQMGTVRRGH